MPLYEYKCNQCDNQFESIVKISNRDDIRQCPICNSDSKRIVTKINLASMVGGILSKTNDDFKEMVRQIDKGHPNNTMNIE